MLKNITLGTKVQCPMNNSKGHIRGEIINLTRSNRKEGILLTNTDVQIQVFLNECVILDKNN